MPKLKATLLTGRTIDQGVGKEHGKLSEKYQENVAICHMDPEDIRSLGIRENENVRIITNFGSVVVKLVKSPTAPHPKVIFIPYGPWASLVMDPETHGTGMPSLKGIPAEIEPALEERVSSIPDLLEEHYKRE
jgi:formylmethanofuran dehydrogenase subunit D